MTKGFTALDVFTTAGVVALFTQVMGSLDYRVVALWAILTVARLFIVLRQIKAQLEPIDDSTDAEADDQEVSSSQSAADLRAADRKVQAAPLRLALIAAGSWMMCTFIAPAGVWFASNAEFEKSRYIAAGLIISGFALGIFAVALPFVDMFVLEAAGAISVTANTLGVVLRRPRRSIAGRIVTVIGVVAAAIGLTALGAGIGLTAPDSNETSLFAMVSTAALVLVMSLVGAYASSLWLTRSILAPLKQLSSATQGLAAQGDLSKIPRVSHAVHDEFGDLIRNVNEVVASLSNLARTANLVGAGNLEVAIEGKGQLAEAFRTLVARLRMVVEETRTTSSELASAAAEISAAAQELEVASSSQASGMIEIAQTMESLSKSAAHVSDAVQGVAQNAERTLQNTEQMVSRIDSLSTHANRIGDILEIIREIANQSDLLALNGSLEATRVGETGRGFALVAGEMRRLAERVTASVQDVKKLVADIRESGASTVVATEESKKLAEATAGAARNITLVTQQQRNSTEQVNQSVRALSEIVEQAALATTQTRTSAEGLRVFADRLSQLVMAFSTTK
jgi:methyl-accepting chemotaxis protein